MEGAAQIQAVMDRLRTAPPEVLGGIQVLAVRDYQKGIRTDRNTGETMPVGLPSSNVLYFELGNDSWCCARPSGTEPKLKFYPEYGDCDFADGGGSVVYEYLQ